MALAEDPIIRQRLEREVARTLPHQRRTPRHEQGFAVGGNVVNVGVNAGALPQQCLHALHYRSLPGHLAVLAGLAVIAHLRPHLHVAGKMQVPDLAWEIRPNAFLHVTGFRIPLCAGHATTNGTGGYRRAKLHRATRAFEGNGAVGQRPGGLATPPADIVLHNEVRVVAGGGTLQVLGVEVHDLREEARAAHLQVALLVLFVAAHMVPHAQPATGRGLAVLQQLHQTIRLGVVLDEARGDEDRHWGLVGLRGELAVPPVLVAADRVDAVAEIVGEAVRVGQLVHAVFEVALGVVEHAARAHGDFVVGDAGAHRVVVGHLVVVHVRVALHGGLLRHYCRQAAGLVSGGDEAGGPVIGLPEEAHAPIGPGLGGRPLNCRHHILLLAGAIPVQAAGGGAGATQVHLNPRVAGFHDVGFVDEVLEARVGVVGDGGVEEGEAAFGREDDTGEAEVCQMVEVGAYRHNDRGPHVVRNTFGAQHIRVDGGAVWGGEVVLCPVGVLIPVNGARVLQAGWGEGEAGSAGGVGAAGCRGGAQAGGGLGRCSGGKRAG